MSDGTKGQKNVPVQNLVQNVVQKTTTVATNQINLRLNIIRFRNPPTAVRSLPHTRYALLVGPPKSRLVRIASRSMKTENVTNRPTMAHTVVLRWA